jgi:hypothetical protein
MRNLSDRGILLLHRRGHSSVNCLISCTRSAICRAFAFLMRGICAAGSARNDGGGC